jgi:septum formation protein
MNQKNKLIILASSSPRRKDLLSKMGVQFIVKPSTYKEVMDETISPKKLAENLAYGKSLSVAKKNKNAIIIGADTFVVLHKTYLGKAKTKEEAKQMLQMLQGKKHFVITGLCVIDTNTNKTFTKSVKTNVWVKKLSEHEIDSYIATGEYLGKAGAYALQGKAILFIEKIEGDLNAAIGLPIKDLTEIFIALKIPFSY